jgi:hypothetical protein
MGRHEVHLLAFPLDSVKFLLECLGSISEPLLAAWETLIELGVLPPEVALSLAPSQRSSSGDLHFDCSKNLFFSLIAEGFNLSHHEDLSIIIRVRLR